MSRPLKSLAYARRRIRELESVLRENQRLLSEFHRHRLKLAKLAGAGCFDNPLHIAEARKLRDEILREYCGMRPDGTPITR